MSNQRMSRPKIKIPKTTSEWIWDSIGIIIFMGSILFLFLQWNNIPEVVPGHYNIKGEVDRWGEKWELLVLPAFSAIIFIGLSILEKFPQVYNYPQKFNPSNAEQFYLINRKLLNQLKNIGLIIFAYLLYESVTNALGWDYDLGLWFLPVALLCVAIPIILFLIKQSKIK